MAVVYCSRGGVIGIGRRAPRGTLALISGPGRPLRSIVEVVARHAYTGGDLLVPGIPEATSDVEALEAAGSFRDQVARRLADRVGATATGGLPL
ncbi:host nuclease inhibitor protein [Methylobacterium sp. SyP6R]|uniref:host nuclease inhibitor protein n=1 Tax=Methylobacterium sp. SyP6R TaxID=2718876 RepID=UPI001F186E20|nr:host nuclease inhibitor protein [Methylobacterium sp. SyP6R]MCF4125015.1 host nuclease inhibitor protein [Methylobacterium sp. SyP6R]